MATLASVLAATPTIALAVPMNCVVHALPAPDSADAQAGAVQYAEDVRGRRLYCKSKILASHVPSARRKLLRLLQACERRGYPRNTQTHITPASTNC